MIAYVFSVKRRFDNQGDDHILATAILLNSRFMGVNVCNVNNRETLKTKRTRAMKISKVLRKNKKLHQLSGSAFSVTLERHEVCSASLSECDCEHITEQCSTICRTETATCSKLPVKWILLRRSKLVQGVRTDDHCVKRCHLIKARSIVFSVKEKKII